MPFIENTHIQNVFSVSIGGALTAAPGRHGMHVHVPPPCVFRCRCVLQCPTLCLYIFIANRFEVVFTLRTGRTFTQATEGLWKTRALGGRDVGIPPFKMPTLQKGMLWAKESMRDGYCPKMLLYALDKLFYIYMQIKNSQRVGDKLMLAYEILCISANHCTDRQNGVKKTGVPDALALLNVADIYHLEHLAWVVYDGVLLVGPWPKLLGNRPWCTVLAGLQRHIYRVRNDAAHCRPQMLSSWDHEE